MRRLTLMMSVLVTLSASGAASGLVTTAPARAFATEVLDRAVLPVAAVRLATLPSGVPMPLWGGSPAGATDIHRLYRVPGAEATVYGYLTRHLPRGSRISSSGTFGDDTTSGEGFSASMPVSGPDQYSAQLSFALEAVSTAVSILRVDAAVIWVPIRTGAQRVPESGTATVTGYAKASLMGPPTGPVVVHLGSLALEKLAKQINALTIAPDAMCMEDSTLYSVTIRQGTLTRPTYTLKGLECMNSVTLSANGKTIASLDDRGCRVLGAVVADLPSGRASATRAALSECLAGITRS